MNTEKLPIGIQSFFEIRTAGYVYVDKTRFIASLVGSGKYYFLSRPRRFGKSLFIDTLDCAFSGKRDLFTGLYLSSEKAGWNFSQKHPVLRIDWSVSPSRSKEDLKERIDELTRQWAAEWGCILSEGTTGGRFENLIKFIFDKSGQQIVILVDEYDKPILDNLENPALAAELRDILKDFYGALKPLDRYLRFVFLTGVSKFAKTGIFSGLNNLKDITLDRRYSAICGYTQTDLTTVFAPRVAGLSISDISAWYNGYSWTGEPVYNPFDILLFLDEGVFKPYWFETGTPSFLIKLLQEKPRSLPDLDNLIAGEELLGSFRIEDLKPETLLFQSGYLTIKSESKVGGKILYHLGFPNLEVKSSFSQLMLDFFIGTPEQSANQVQLDLALSSSDTDLLRDLFHSFFASIPHDWYRKNQISGFEGYYASVVYAYFASLGYIVIPEDTTNKGRVDLTVKTRTGIWLFEFKVKGLDQTITKNPLKQLQEKGYAEKYRSDGRPVHEIGIVFNPETRNIEEWEVGEV